MKRLYIGPKRWAFIILGLLLHASIWILPIFVKREPSLVSPQMIEEAIVFIARWENKPLAEGVLLHADGLFPGGKKAAVACDKKRGGCKEGISIGFEYNLAAHRPYQFLLDLEKVVGHERATNMLHCVGLAGEKAFETCHGDSKLRMTRDEAVALLRIRVERDAELVERKIRREEVTLTCQQVISLLSVCYTSHALVLEADLFWAAVKRGDWDEAANQIAYNSGSQRDYKLAKRRMAEAEPFRRKWFVIR